MSANKRFTSEEFAAKEQAKIDARDQMVARNDPRYLQALRDANPAPSFTERTQGIRTDLVFVPIFGDPNLGYDIYEVEK